MRATRATMVWIVGLIGDNLPAVKLFSALW
jgi:hypothetical protein